MVLEELAPEIDLAGLAALTAARFEVSPDLAPMPV